MPFSRLLKDNVTISRLTAGTGVQKTYVTFASNIKSMVQPLGAEQSALHGLAMGKGYKMFVDVQGVEAGDKVVFGTQEFRVLGSQDYNFAGSKRKHQMLVMTKEDS